MARHAVRSVIPPPAAGCFDAVVLGSGVSTAAPQLSHVLLGQCENATRAIRKDGRTVCEEAFQNKSSKNRRFNVSLLVRYAPSDGSRVRHVMVDAGKTMREAALASLPFFGVRTIDSLLLTHDHADAIMGMDDLRDLQVIEKVFEGGEHIGHQLENGDGPMQIISNKMTIDRVREAFPYLHTKPEFVRPGILRRRIAYLQFKEVSNEEALEVCGLPVRLFPVWHGGTYVSLGFAFGLRKDGYPLVYISDVKEVPPKTMAFLETAAADGISLLLLDALNRTGHPTHMSLDDALALVRRLRPARTLLIGMDSCAVGDHEEVNEELRALLRTEGLDVQLAYDGQHLPEFPARNENGDASETPEAKAKRRCTDDARL
ncbi:unnamed protein product [Effrenium voratum]|nr:unnamed protein product [Effrenium voratum]CAJ1412959.1 unnamed protein product [Effrenium voratum]